MSAPDAGVTKSSPHTDQQPTPTGLEIQESHRRAERRAARLGISPKKINGAAGGSPGERLILASPL